MTSLTHKGRAMELTYEFDMGIPLSGGWTFGGGIIGSADIGYNADGDWWVESITVEISKYINGAWKTVPYGLDVFKPEEHRYYHFLREIIHKYHRDEIQEIVDDELRPLTYEPNPMQAGRAL